SRMISTKEYEKRYRSRCSRSLRPSQSVFSRLRRNRSRSPNPKEKEGDVFKRLGSRGRSVSARSDSHNQPSYSKYADALSKSKDSRSGHWKSRLKKKKLNKEEDDLSQPWESSPDANCIQTGSRKGGKKVGKKQAEGAKKGEHPGKDKSVSHLSNDEDEGTEAQRLSNEAEIGGHCIHRMYVDGGSASEILYEHCFTRLRPEIKKQLVLATTPLIGFNGEIIWPIRQIQLLVKIGDEDHFTLAWMNFVVVRSPSSYNGIIGRPGVRKLQAVPSTAHGMLKLPVEGGVITLKSSRLVPLKCALVSGLEGTPSAAKPTVEERIKVAINPKYPEQTKPADMTGVPRHIVEHYLNVHKGCPPVRQKKRGQAAKRNLAIQEEVGKLVEARIMRKVHYHDWLSNPVMVKKHDDSWRMCVDFKDLNNACPKDGYPLPEIDWKVESLCGFPFKCFLDAYKGYHQIQIAKEDEEKTTFITNQGIFCYTKMPFGLRNVGATYQRLVDKAFHKQIGRNIKVYVDDLVIKSHTKDEIVRDIKETFKTLREINMLGFMFY
ncbi:reverse transcriptase domain-containing protein, partial [Tanacetum coccineum]